MSVPLFQKGNMALILRTVIWIVFFGILFYLSIMEGFDGENIFIASMLWIASCVITIFVLSFFCNAEEQEKLRIVPIEFAVYLASKKKEAVNEMPKLLSEINSKVGKNNPHFTDLETAKRFLLAEKPKQEYIEKQEEIIKEENSRILEKIEKAVKGEVFRTIHKKEFPVSITDKDVMVIIGISIQKTELYKKKVEGKPIFINSLLKYTEKDLTPVLQNNPVIEQYINETVKKVNEKLGSEVK